MRRSVSALFCRYHVGLLIGTVAGVVSLPAGFFIALQVLPPLGTVLLAPFVALSLLSDTPVAMMSPVLQMTAAGITIGTYAGLGALVQHLIRRRDDDR